MEEIWRDIKGFEGRYQVSNMGRVKSFCHREEKILTPILTIKKYHSVSIGRKRIFVHKLVAQAFPEICGEWFDGAQINHKNEIKTDNRAENIELCDAFYNNNYGTHNERVAKAHWRPVRQYQKTSEGKILIAEYPCIKEAAKAVGGHKSNISACCLGRQYMYKGFLWRYTTES